MNQFRSGSNKERKFLIDSTSREWVEHGFLWLIAVCKNPENQNEVFLPNEKNFPKTYSTEEVNVQNIIGDLSSLLDLDDLDFTFEFDQDSGLPGEIPFVVYGKPFGLKILSEENGYTFLIDRRLLQNTQRLIYAFVYSFVNIRLTENKMGLALKHWTPNALIYIVGIYFGFGVIMAQAMYDDELMKSVPFPQKWSYLSDMPLNFMAFALATSARLANQEDPDWKSELPTTMKIAFEGALQFLNENPSKLLSKKELVARTMYKEAFKASQQNEFDATIKKLQAMVSLTEDDMMKGFAYNNMGYYMTRQENFEESIPVFRKALSFSPNLRFVYDNLCYALIRVGHLEEGKDSLEKATGTENRHPGYSYRNLALYYQAKGKPTLAERNFKLAFENMGNSVDLLELYCAEFMIEKGETEMGLEYLKMAVEKGEPEAIRKMEEFE